MNLFKRKKSSKKNKFKFSWISANELAVGSFPKNSSDKRLLQSQGIKGVLSLCSINEVKENIPDNVFEGFNRGAAGGVTIDNFANGGRPPVGRPSIVGEKGAELFVPDRAGTIIPNHELGGGMNIVVNVDASGSNVEGDEDEGRALGIALSAAIETELIKQKRPGGLLA